MIGKTVEGRECILRGSKAYDFTSGKPIPTKPTLSISALATLPSPPATASIPLSPPACAPLPVPFAPANSPSSPTMSQKPMLDIRKRVVSQLKELIPEPTAMEIEQHMFTHARRNGLSKYFAILKRNNVDWQQARYSPNLAITTFANFGMPRRKYVSDLTLRT